MWAKRILASSAAFLASFGLTKHCGTKHWSRARGPYPTDIVRAQTPYSITYRATPRLVTQKPQRNPLLLRGHLTSFNNRHFIHIIVIITAGKMYVVSVRLEILYFVYKTNIYTRKNNILEQYTCHWI